MNKIFLNLLLTILLLAFWGCSNDDPPVMVGGTPSIDEIKTAEKWNPRLSQKYKVEVSVLDPQGPENIAGVYLNVQRDSGGPVIYTDSLYDDGAFFNTEDGDVLAKDGIFSNRFSPSQISSPVQSGFFLLKFVALDHDGHQSPEGEFLVSFGENSAPAITAVLAPDSLSVNLVPGIIQVTVRDSDGVDDIKRVYFESQKKGTSQIRYESELYNDGDPNHGDMVAGDEIYSLKLDTGFLVAKKGLYDLLFHAEDSFDEKNQAIPVHEIAIYNKISLIKNIQIPDTMVIPNEHTYNYSSLSLLAEDPESLFDIRSVYYYSFRNDTALFSGKPVKLKDNGIAFDYFNYVNELITFDVRSVGDEIAGDGIYTFPLVIESYFKPGAYLFRFYISDKAGNLTGPEDRILNVIR